MISCVVQQRKPPPMKATCTMRDYRNLDSSVFVGDLTDRLASTPATSDVNILLEHFNEVLRTVLDTHAPQSTRTRTIRPQAKWYNDEIRAEKREQRRLERKWRKNRLTVNRDSYMVQHEKVISLIEKAKENHYKDVLYNASVKDTFKTLGVLLNKNCRALPTFDTPDELCNKFAQFFTDKVAKIRGNIDSNTVVSPPSIVTRNNIVVANDLVSFKELDETEVRDIIMSCANKSCSLDYMPTWMVREYIDIVIPHITCIVNNSLTTGIFPHNLKQAMVTPIIKKVTLDWNDLQNYRPVSSINFIGKVIEKAVIKQVSKHLEENNLDETLQSAYKNKHSTETALLQVKQLVLCSSCHPVWKKYVAG
ncbi:uncharacterized protein [Amphiura filiformis]|uniref:uncharacterized protein n=1 Tax=Amphiura filiformis TaxID=82378 RepID=UPI003B21FF71